MNDPRDDLLDEPLDPVLRDLYDAEAVAPLAAGCEQRVLAGALGRLTQAPTGPDSAAGDAPGGEAAAALRTAGSTMATSKAVALALTTAIVGAVAGVAADRQLRPPAQSSHEPAAQPVLMEKRERHDAAPPPPTPAPLPPTARDAGLERPATPNERTRSVDRQSPRDSSRAREARLIDRARAALRRGLLDDALIALMQHERIFPDGQLVEERDVLVIETYLAKGDHRIAARRIQAYRRAHPDGLHGSRVDRAEAELR